jgi:hypothetical protein
MSQCLLILAAGERLRTLSPDLLGWRKSPGAMFRATGGGSIPQATVSLVQLRRADRRQHRPHPAQTGNPRKAGETGPPPGQGVTWGKVTDG